MNKIFKIIIITLLLPVLLEAQAPNSESLENDSIQIILNSNGINFYSPVTGKPGLEYPKGSRLNLSYLNCLWLSGINANQDSFVCIQTHGQSNRYDFFPGILDHNGYISTQDMYNWNRLWKVTKKEITEYKSSYSKSNFNFHDSKWKNIREWPAKNNVFARGANGSNISTSINSLDRNELAPFEDLNNNGSYEPDLGEFPLCKGDKMLWWVYNDVAQKKTQSNSPSMGMQVVTICYIFNESSVLDNQIFFESKIYNKGKEDFKEFCISNVFDGEIASEYDDQVGTDLLNRVSYTYVDKLKNPNFATNPYKLNGFNTPSVGLYFHSSISRNLPSALYSSIYFDNGTGAKGRVMAICDVFRYRDGFDKMGQAFRSKCDSSVGQPTKFPFSQAGDKMCDCNIQPTDFHSLQSTTPSNFYSGEVQEIKYAVVISNQEIQCARENPWTDICNTISPIFELPLSNDQVQVSQNSLRVYPNPTNTRLSIESQKYPLEHVEVFLYNSIGQKISPNIIGKDSKLIRLDLTDLVEGFYILNFQSKEISLPSYPIQVLHY